ISRLPQTSTRSKNRFALLSSSRTLGGSVCAYSRGLAPLRNSSSISVRTGKKAVHTFQSSSEIVGYGMASLVLLLPHQAAGPPSDNFQRTYSSLLFVNNYFALAVVRSTKMIHIKFFPPCIIPAWKC